MELARARHVIADRCARPAPPSAARAPGRRARGRTRGPCPYKGLLRFEPEDAGWYFGRERLVAELLASVASTRCTGIVGASGSGKSSLTRAGLVAALRDDALPGSASWPRAPGDARRATRCSSSPGPWHRCATPRHPTTSATGCSTSRSRCRRSPRRRQPERRRGVARDRRRSARRGVHRLPRRRACATAFSTSSCTAPRDPDAPIRSFAAIRADYYGRCADHADVRGPARPGERPVGPMRPDELQRAIEEPARNAGLVLEDGLVDRSSTTSAPSPARSRSSRPRCSRRGPAGTATLTSTAMWRRAASRRGRAARRRRVRHACPRRGNVARGIFLRLAEPGVGTDDVRRRAPLDELVVDDDHARGARRAGRAPPGRHRRQHAEVAHEALLREWPRLRSGSRRIARAAGSIASLAVRRPRVGRRRPRRRPGVPGLPARRRARRRRRPSGRDQSRSNATSLLPPRAPGRRAALRAPHRAPLPPVHDRPLVPACCGGDRRSRGRAAGLEGPAFRDTCATRVEAAGGLASRRGSPAHFRRLKARPAPPARGPGAPSCRAPRPMARSSTWSSRSHRT